MRLCSGQLGARVEHRAGGAQGTGPVVALIPGAESFPGVPPSHEVALAVAGGAGGDRGPGGVDGVEQGAQATA